MAATATTIVSRDHNIPDLAQGDVFRLKDGTTVTLGGFVTPDRGKPDGWRVVLLWPFQRTASDPVPACAVTLVTRADLAGAIQRDFVTCDRRRLLRPDAARLMQEHSRAIQDAVEKPAPTKRMRQEPDAWQKRRPELETTTAKFCEHPGKTSVIKVVPPPKPKPPSPRAQPKSTRRTPSRSTPTRSAKSSPPETKVRERAPPQADRADDDFIKKLKVRGDAIEAARAGLTEEQGIQLLEQIGTLAANVESLGGQLSGMTTVLTQVLTSCSQTLPSAIANGLKKLGDDLGDPDNDKNNNTQFLQQLIMNQASQVGGHHGVGHGQGGGCGHDPFGHGGGAGFGTGGRHNHGHGGGAHRREHGRRGHGDSGGRRSRSRSRSHSNRRSRSRSPSHSRSRSPTGSDVSTSKRSSSSRRPHR